MLKSPYENTFYIDSDTYFCEKCDELFSLLDYFDLLIAPAPNDISMALIKDNKAHGLYPYNTGVIVFKKNQAILSFFHDWKDAFQNNIKSYGQDQPAFMEAFALNTVKIYTLQHIYNFRTPFFVTVPDAKVKIIHGRHSETEFSKIKNKINKTILHRTWNPKTKKVQLFKSEFKLYLERKLSARTKERLLKIKERYIG